MSREYLLLSFDDTLTRLRTLRDEGHTVDLSPLSEHSAALRFRPKPRGREMGVRLEGVVGEDSKGVFLDMRVRPEIAGAVIFGLIVVVSLVGAAWRVAVLIGGIYGINFTIEAARAYSALRQIQTPNQPEEPTR